MFMSYFEFFSVTRLEGFFRVSYEDLFEKYHDFIIVT